MKNYRNSHISCLINAMAVLLLLLLVSCSSNWRLAYLQNKEYRSLSAVNADAKSIDTVKTNGDTLNELSQIEEREPNTQENSQQNSKKNQEITLNSDGEQIGDGIELEEITVIGVRGEVEIDKDGNMPMGMIISVPKDLISADWQMRLHRTMYFSQNKTISPNGKAIEDIYITGSVYRDKQIKGYERYTKYLNKLISDGTDYYNTKDLNSALKVNLSEFVNKYQLEYFIQRNFPEIYSFKNDSSYVTDEEFSAVLDEQKNRIINHYKNRTIEDKINKLRGQNKDSVQKEFIKNPITTKNISADKLIDKNEIYGFDNMYTEVLKKIKSTDSLKTKYYSYIESLNSQNSNTDDNTKEKLSYPELISEKYNFKLNKDTIIYKEDTTRIYFELKDSTQIKAAEYDNLDKVLIVISGDIYQDNKEILHFTIPDTLKYLVTSTADYADTNEIWYRDSLIFRKAESNEAYSIGFERRSSTLNERFGNNAEEIANVKAKLESLLENAEYDLDSIIISATASPEGTLKINSDYSEKRSQAISRYFQSYVNSHRKKYEIKADSIRLDKEGEINSVEVAFIDGLLTQRERDGIIDSLKKVIEATKMPDIKFTYKPIPENWDDLYTYVSMDSIMTQDEKNLFYDTYDKYSNVDVRENAMKKHSYYNYMLNNLYTKIRVVKFQFHMHKKGMLFDTLRVKVPDKLYMDGVKALRRYDFKTAEEILKNYPTYNAAILFIVKEKPLQAVNILEQPSLQIDYERIKIKRDHLTQLYINTDSTNIELKDSLLKQIEIVKDSMNRVGKIEFLKSKAYFMNFTRSGRKYIEYLDKALASYFNLMKYDKINGFYNKMMTGEANNKSSVLGSDNYFIFTANGDKYLSLLHKMKYCDEKIQKYKLELVTQYWKEQKLAFTEKDKQEYNNLVEAYMYDYASEEELERFIMCEFNGIDINTLNSTKSVD